MTRRPRVVAGGLLIAFGCGLLGLALYAIVRPDRTSEQISTALRAVLARPLVAHDPFPGLTETRLGVGGRCLRVVIADAEVERETGLMGRASLGDYDGMLFVVPASTENAFTMAGTPVPLDIGWYRSDGAPVGTARMAPCHDTAAACPRYTPPARWRFALETMRGELPSGSLGACA